MSDDKGSVVPRAPRLPAQPGAPVRRPGGAVPIHQGTGLHLSDENPGREECWSTLGSRLIARINELCGEIITWYAEVDREAGDGRSRCVVLGQNALCIAEPRFTADKRGVYSLNVYELDPASQRIAAVHGNGGSGSDTGPPRVGPGLPKPTTPAVAAAFSDTARGELGNLPAEAQKLVQAPFVRDDKVLRFECWYEGYPTRLDTYLLIVAGAKNLTAAVGSQFLPAGAAPAAAQWSLQCHRFTVTRRVGR